MLLARFVLFSFDDIIIKRKHLNMLKLLLLFIVVENVRCGFNRTLFKTFPKKGVQCTFEELLGTWFIQYQIAPCSWKGSEEFTNFVKQISLVDTKPCVKLHWRSGNGCVNNIQVDVKCTDQGECLASDRIGGMINGNKMLLSTDCKTYTIGWGCTRKCELSGTCMDPFMMVETIDRTPSVKTLNIIKKKILELWNMVLIETVEVNQDENNCCIPKTTQLEC